MYKNSKQSQGRNLIGQRFGKWTVIASAPSAKGKRRWLCKCQCGTVREVSEGHLINFRSKSCGCGRYKPPAADLLGKKFHRWTVVEKVGKSKHNSTLWRCVCDCGNEAVHASNTLLSGRSKSCGCLKKDNAYSRRENLVGQRFGKLTVIERAEDHIYPDGSHRPCFKCKCDCGNEIIVMSNSLKNGTCRSCGCLISKGELKISDLLLSFNIDFTKQKHYEDLKSDKGIFLRFDFYIYDGNYLIEYDGEHHFICTKRKWNTESKFKEVQKRDKLKNNYCRERGIPLIRIPYTQYELLTIDDLKLETTKFRVV